MARTQAVKELQKSGFDLKKLSVVGKDYHIDTQIVGHYNAGDRTEYWGKWGAFRGGLSKIGSCFRRAPDPVHNLYPSKRSEDDFSREQAEVATVASSV